MHESGRNGGLPREVCDLYIKVTNACVNVGGCVLCEVV